MAITSHKTFAVFTLCPSAAWARPTVECCVIVGEAELGRGGPKLELGTERKEDIKKEVVLTKSSRKMAG
jgi:hypothetical protein